MTTPPLDALLSVSFCFDLSPEAIAALGRAVRTVKRRAGANILLQGDPAEAMYVVVAGRVKVCRASSRGREQVLHTAGPAEHFNLVPMFEGGACPASVVAISDVTLLALPRERLHGLIRLYPDLALALLRELSTYLRRMVDLVDDLALRTVQGRLVGLLLALAESAERGEVAPPLTQAEMASRLGTVREVVSRSLRSLEAAGLITVERGDVTVLDQEGLAALREA
jgi:CRP-like cAMP-binding protein